RKFGGRPEFVLGETVVMNFCLKNRGFKSIDMVAEKGSGRNQRTPHFWVEVRGTDSQGQRLRNPNIAGRYKRSQIFKEPPFSEIQKMSPGEQWCKKLFLHRVVHIDQPGVYKIEAYHHFRDGVTNEPFSSPSKAWNQVQFRLPSNEQAQAMVEQAFELPDSYFHIPYYVNDEKFETPYIDLAAFSHPIFLPLLKEKAHQGDTRAVEGISAIKAPEATEVLLDFLKSSHPEIIYSTWNALSRRLPDPYTLERPVSEHTTQLARERILDEKSEIAASWRSEFSPRIRSHIPRFLDSSDDKLRFYGARIIRMFPDPSDVPLLTKAMTQALDEYETPLTMRREMVTALISAGFSLAQFQEAVPKSPKSDGEIALYIIALKWENQNKRKVGLRGLEEKVEMWRNHHSKVIRKLITGGSW
ncbi:MAG: hypothetical protein KC643_32245, partial [Nitrospira sp.]|nr:hypothetical protein [Nitrospira sp.]